MKDVACLCLGVAAVFVTHVCVAADRYFFPPQSLAAGAIDQTIEMRFDNDVAILAYSSGFTYDNSVLAVNGVSTTGTVAETAFLVMTVDAGAGTVGFAAVLMLDASGMFVDVDRDVPLGQNRAMAFLDVDVLATTDVVTTIIFADVVPDPSIPALSWKNVMTKDGGVSIAPSLVDGVITIQDRTPRILSFAGNSGLSGQVFQVEGSFFNEPGLIVRVCGSSTSAVLRGDGVTLDVTAPSCGSLGPAQVEVCTDRGCDADPNGFNYEAPPAPPTISGFQDNTGQEGTVFVILGTNFDVPNLSVLVCNRLAGIVVVNPEGTSIIATAPNCGALGSSRVDVCTDLGCDFDPAGFFYDFAGPRFTRGDCNGDSSVNAIADTIFMLNYLFGSGNQAWTCFAACDFNDDLGFDVSDAVFHLLAAFAGGAPLPPPTTCGPGAEGSFLFGCEMPQC